MTNYKISTTCKACNGTGIISGSESNPNIPCPNCSQTGYEFQAQIEDLKDDIDDIKDKLNDIMERLKE